MYWQAMQSMSSEEPGTLHWHLLMYGSKSIGRYITHSSPGNGLRSVLKLKINILNSTLGQAESQQKEKCSKRMMVMQPEQWSCSQLQYRKAWQPPASSLPASLSCCNPVPKAALVAWVWEAVIDAGSPTCSFSRVVANVLPLPSPYRGTLKHCLQPPSLSLAAAHQLA